MRSSLVKFSHSFRTEMLSELQVDEFATLDCATSRAWEANSACVALLGSKAVVALGLVF